MTSMVIL